MGTNILKYQKYQISVFLKTGHYQYIENTASPNIYIYIFISKISIDFYIEKNVILFSDYFEF